jgi:hypothetical protein
MKTYFDAPAADPKERKAALSALRRCGFDVAPQGVPLNATFYYYATLDGVNAEHAGSADLLELGLTIITVGEFDDFLSRHISPSDPVSIDSRSGRIVSPARQFKK